MTDARGEWSHEELRLGTSSVSSPSRDAPRRRHARLLTVAVALALVVTLVTTGRPATPRSALDRGSVPAVTVVEATPGQGMVIPWVVTPSGAAAKRVASLDPAPDAWLWVSLGDASVLVPQGWKPTRRSGGDDWLELSADGRTCLQDALSSMECLAASPSPTLIMQPYAPALPAAEPTSSVVRARRVGSVWLICGAPGSDAALVDRIIDSAVVIA